MDGDEEEGEDIVAKERKRGERGESMERGYDRGELGRGRRREGRMSSVDGDEEGRIKT